MRFGRDVEDGAPGAPVDRASSDFALVIGVDHYPRFRSLRGAVNDARHVHRWLCDPRGGGVELAHARLLVSSPDAIAPLQDHIDDALREVVDAAEAAGGGRRLYFYFAGHGAMSVGERGEDVALLLAKWSPRGPRTALSLEDYRRRIAAAGLFDELAMFIDGCRAAAERAIGQGPTIELGRGAARRPTRTFVAHAVEPRSAAREAEIAGEWRGVFTARLLELLQQAPGIRAAELKAALERPDAAQPGHVEHGVPDDVAFGVPAEATADAAAGADWSDAQLAAAQRCTAQPTCAALGEPATSGLVVLVARDPAPSDCMPGVPSEEAFAIHDLCGRLLVRIDAETTRVDREAGCLAFSCRLPPGTYRLRARRAGRDLAITIPPDRAAHVTIRDRGAVRFDELRVALVGAGHRFDPAGPLARAADAALRALEVPDGVLPAASRSMLPDAADDDLCLGVAAAHLLWRAGDRTGFDQLMGRLRRFVAEIPDLAVLDQLRWERRSVPELVREVPPLVRASLVLLMAQPAWMLPLSASSALFGPVARAMHSGLHDSVWCMWTERRFYDGWLGSTIEGMPAPDRAARRDAITRIVRLPTRVVAHTLTQLDATLPTSGPRGEVSEIRVPGYVIGEPIGRGSQGTVFRARRARDDRPVALKVVPLCGDEQRRRLARELEVQRDLHHAAVLTFDAAGYLSDRPAAWLEAELCRGSVLDLLNDAAAPLPVADACRIVLEALDGLACLHDRGVVHRDLKPSNLLIRTNDRVVIGDLGLAKPFARPGRREDNAISAPAGAGGTAAFAAPEQLANFRYANWASDVWSMAATLYFLLTLELPREHFADQDDLEAAQCNPVVPIADRWPEAPSRLASCIDRALSPDIADRPAHAHQLRDALIAALDGIL